LSTLQHPAGLNPFKQYRQASQILSKTSRAKNPAWYQDPLELDFQLHLRTDGAGVMAFLHDKRENLWAPGPPLTEQQLIEPEAITAYVTAALEHVRSAGGTSLGIILHIADELSLTEIKPELHNRENLDQLREQAVHDPASILADSIQTEQSSWRILPYFAPTSQAVATAITVSRRYEPTLAALRSLGESEDFPIIVTALSAPLLALLGLHGTITRTPGRPSVAILQYQSFTVIAFFDANTDLLLLRTQLHRGLQRPPNFRHAIATALASLELDSPDIFVFGLGPEVDSKLVADLQPVFPGSHIEQVVPQGAGVVPAWCAEVLISTQVHEQIDELPGHTLRAFIEEGWAFQNFIPPSKEQAEIFPTKQEITLLRVLRYARVAAVLIALAVIAMLIHGPYEIVRSPEWAFNPAEADTIKQRLVALNMEKQRIEHWDSVMEDRSKCWAVMESITHLFPPDSGLLVRDMEYSSRPDSTPGQARVGVVREWTIKGMTKQEGIQFLNTLNSREGVSARFNEIARATGDASFRTDIGTRNLVVSIRTQENSTYRRGAPPPSAVMANPIPPDYDYPFTFDLEITQRFEAADPLAILSAKAP